jgi:hypothetical protein
VLDLGLRVIRVRLAMFREDVGASCLHWVADVPQYSWSSVKAHISLHIRIARTDSPHPNS